MPKFQLLCTAQKARQLHALFGASFRQNQSSTNGEKSATFMRLKSRLLLCFEHKTATETKQPACFECCATHKQSSSDYWFNETKIATELKRKQRQPPWKRRASRKVSRVKQQPWSSKLQLNELQFNQETLRRQEMSRRSGWLFSRSLFVSFVVEQIQARLSTCVRVRDLRERRNLRPNQSSSQR